MIRLGKIEGTNIYEFVIDGKLDEATINEFYELIKKTADEGNKILLLGVIESWPGFATFKTFTTTMKLKAKSIGHIAKYAIMSNKGWLESVMPVSDFLTPGMPVKHFKMDMRDAAIEWLQAVEVNPENPEDYFSKMKIERIENTNIYRFVIDDEIDEAGISAFFQILKNHPKPDKFRALGIVKGFPSFESFKTLVDGLRLDFAMMGRIDRYAVVTNKNWAQYSIKVADLITPGLEMKLFEADKEDEALNWLMEA
ncbi:STAS/SEC14 domain-containing protein [Aureitalea marina]|uniref:STAS/SEC14 domain-containing protein n=1 Tax=Aureitalea marina TaxID=930804 RepID=A0A2S7KS02_9FLAO|nr:STAS/SEC14 domain-containing protein [Aureitalea marina]PQB05390.1 hypothetical protein BST85_11190 [Aureitalea marina]